MNAACGQRASTVIQWPLGECTRELTLCRYHSNLWLAYRPSGQGAWEQATLYELWSNDDRVCPGLPTLVREGGTA